MSQRLTLSEERQLLADARHQLRLVSHEEWQAHVRETLGVAHADQLFAAVRESGRLLRDAHPPHLAHHTAVDTHEGTALLFAAAARCLAGNRCEHAVRADRPLIAFAAARVIACEECVFRFTGAIAAADQRNKAGDRMCDLCLEEQPPGRLFRPFGAHFGAARIFGDMCAACNELLRPEQRRAA